jgi:hypothetical protein
VWEGEKKGRMKKEKQKEVGKKMMCGGTTENKTLR